MHRLLGVAEPVEPRAAHGALAHGRAPGVEARAQVHLDRRGVGRHEREVALGAAREGVVVLDRRGGRRSGDDGRVRERRRRSGSGSRRERGPSAGRREPERDERVLARAHPPLRRRLPLRARCPPRALERRLRRLGARARRAALLLLVLRLRRGRAGLRGVQVREVRVRVGGAGDGRVDVGRVGLRGGESGCRRGEERREALEGGGAGRGGGLGGRGWRRRCCGGCGVLDVCGRAWRKSKSRASERARRRGRVERTLHRVVVDGEDGLALLPLLKVRVAAQDGMDRVEVRLLQADLGCEREGGRGQRRGA